MTDFTQILVFGANLKLVTIYPFAALYWWSTDYSYLDLRTVSTHFLSSWKVVDKKPWQLHRINRWRNSINKSICHYGPDVHIIGSRLIWQNRNLGHRLHSGFTRLRKPAINYKYGQLLFLPKKKCCSLGNGIAKQNS